MTIDVLAVGAHPDDIELSCSGTIIKLVKQGKKVGLVDLTGGELGTRGDRETRSKEAARAAEIMGASFRENLRMPDGDIEVNAENRLKLINVIRFCRPQIMLIPYSVDRHPDHEHAHKLAKESWFYAGLEKMETLRDGKKQKAFRPRAYYQYMQWNEFTPSFIVDVSAEFDRRMEAVQAFRSQFYSPGSPEPETVLSSPAFMRMLKTRLEYYGSKIGRRYGEPFYSHLPVRIDDIVSLHA